MKELSLNHSTLTLNDVSPLYFLYWDIAFTIHALVFIALALGVFHILPLTGVLEYVFYAVTLGLFVAGAILHVRARRILRQTFS
jgi:polyferredoxin